LAAGIAIALAAMAVFGEIARNALTDGPLVALDRAIAKEMMEASKDHAILRPIMIAMTQSGGVAAMTILVVLGVVWQGWRGRGKGRVAIGWALIVIGGAIVNQAVKTALQRERPPPEWRDRVVSETNESFPSGHAMGGTIGIGLLGYALMLQDRHWRSKLFIVLGLGAWVISIGLSRVYLRAHWFSDVLGGFTLGLAWLSLGLGILETWRRKGVRSEK
jgi:membrane-associated phospholipid phosphatase